MKTAWIMNAMWEAGIIPEELADRLGIEREEFFRKVALGSFTEEEEHKILRILGPEDEYREEGMKIQLDEGALLPKRANPTDAGLDLLSPVDTVLWPYSRVCIDTGVHVEIPQGCVGLLTSKSGLMRDMGITSSGTIDEGYTGSVGAVLFNHGNQVVKIRRGQKITQLVILPCLTPEIEVVDEISGGARGGRGFGSTGEF